jgi:IMP dehydrogenase/GMP reductase
MISEELKLDFNNILIVPDVHSDITSRYKDIILPDVLPLFTAPMDTVVNLDNMGQFIKNRINVTLPRTITHDAFINQMIAKGVYSPAKWIRDDNYQKVFISMGFAELQDILSRGLRDLCVNAHILIDVANGHMEKVAEFAQDIKTLRPDIIIMVGNIANPETYTWYAEKKCVDYIRVGIGNGGGCLTTKQSGVGYPMASLIHEVFTEKLLYVYDHRNEADLSIPAIVADGGMKDYVDVIKALALGADYVMVGSIFNKALESAGSNYLYKVKINQRQAQYFYNKGYPVKKYFRGMSTKGAQKAMGKTEIKTSEGVVRYQRVEYHLDSWIENFEHYLRNAMSYANARTLNEFIGRANCCKITDKAYDRFNK